MPAVNRNTGLASTGSAYFGRTSPTPQIPLHRLSKYEIEAQRERQHKIERYIKITVLSIATLLFGLVCVYALSQTVFGSESPSLNKSAMSPKNENIDCRKSGCKDEFICVEVEAEFACLAPPCPTSVYQCVPAIFHNNKINSKGSRRMARAAILDSAERDQTLSDLYSQCIKEHGGKRSWKQENNSCNICACTKSGRVACTKRLCIKPGASKLLQQDEASNSDDNEGPVNGATQATRSNTISADDNVSSADSQDNKSTKSYYHLQTTYMSIVGTNTIDGSPIFTSVNIEIWE